MAAAAKICGVTAARDIDAALAGGAAYLGFNFFPASPRALALDVAAGLAAPARGRAGIVAVLVDPSDSLVDAVAHTLRPDFIQLHGRETPSRTREIAMRAGAEVIKVLPIAEAADFALVADYEPVADRLMFDAKAPPGADRPGGLGVRFDPSLLAGRRWARPWFLAGGLDPHNVAGAIRASGAPAVDVSTGVESAPGLKDPALIDAFLAATRGA